MDMGQAVLPLPLTAFPPASYLLPTVKMTVGAPISRRLQDQFRHQCGPVDGIYLHQLPPPQQAPSCRLTCLPR